jgi:hypothetical protein
MPKAAPRRHECLLRQIVGKIAVVAYARDKAS